MAQESNQKDGASVLGVGRERGAKGAEGWKSYPSCSTVRNQGRNVQLSNQQAARDRTIQRHQSNSQNNPLKGLKQLLVGRGKWQRVWWLEAPGLPW